MNPKVDKSAIVNQDSDGSKEDKTALNKWFDDTKQTVEMESVTKNRLVGYKFVNPDAKKWIFVVHGYTSDAKKMVNYIKKFYDMGYSVFAPDLIAHGNSEGDFISMGGYDSDDLVNWVKKISSENNNADTALFGISMGAATVMNAVGKDLPSNVKTGYFFGDVDATKALKETKLPVLVLHGEEDGFVPLEHGKAAYDLITSEKEFHSFPGMKHVQAERKFREQYWNVVGEFLKKHFE